MPRVIVSGNLNTWGNNGQFETDPSTWGYSLPGIVRSNEQATAGVFSSKYTAWENWVIFGGSTHSNLGYYNFSPVNGKKYLFRAKVRSKASQPPANGSSVFSLWLDGQAKTSEVTKTVTVSLDSWQEVEATITYNSGLFPAFGFYLLLGGDVLGGDNTIINGVCYADQLEVYEYIDVEDPDTCDVEIDPEDTDIINETADGAGDGSIDVSATGTGPLEYSKDGDTWQLASLFAGLTTGVYIIHVRQAENISCVDTYPFVVNHGAVAFDFTTIVTNESVSGANDGSIVITPTGAGGPFEFSIDAGATFQLGNNFPDLGPGTYYVVVQDDDGNMIVQVVVINAGIFAFDKIFHSKNPITLQKSASPGYEALTKYRLYCDVRVEDVSDSGVFNSKLKVDLPPDASGNVVFYLGEAFRDAFAPVAPALNANTIIRLTDRIKRYKCFTGELVELETIPEELNEELINLVTLGGIDRFNFPGLNFFTAYLPANKKFLTWAPLEKYVDRLQEDYLNFWVYGNFTTLKLRIKAYFDDSTDQTVVTTQLEGTSYAQLYQVPAGPVNSGASTINPAKNLVKYELALLDQADVVITEIRTYHVDIIGHPLTKYFMFQNSLGSFEVLRFTGQAIRKTQFAREVVQKFLPHNYKAIDGQFKTNQVMRVKQTNLSSGYIKDRFAKEWHEYLEDFIGSPVIYDVTDGRRYPVVVTAGEHTTEDQNNERFIRVDLRDAYDNESYTPKNI